MKVSYLSTSIFSFTVHENAFQRLLCTVIGTGDTSELDNQKNGTNVSWSAVRGLGTNTICIVHIIDILITVNYYKCILLLSPLNI